MTVVLFEVREDPERRSVEMIVEPPGVRELIHRAHHELPKGAWIRHAAFTRKRRAETFDRPYAMLSAPSVRRGARYLASSRAITGLPQQRAFEAKRGVTNSDTVGGLDERVRMNIGDDVPGLPGRSAGILFLVRIERDVSSRRAGTGHSRHALCQKLDGRFVRVKATRADDHVRVPVDLASVEQQKVPSLPRRRCRRPEPRRWSAKPWSPSGSRIPAGNRGLWENLFGNRFERAAGQVRGIRRQRASIQEDGPWQPPDLTREEQVACRLAGCG